MWIANIIMAVIIQITPQVTLEPDSQEISNQVKINTINIVNKGEYYAN
jgi:hypothetical protein